MIKKRAKIVNNQVIPLKRVIFVIGLMAGYASCFQSMPLVAGVILGGALATGNFYWLIFFVSRVIASKEWQGRIQRVCRGLFFFKFFLLSLLLYYLASSGFVDLTGVIGGFTAVLLVVLYNYFLILKEGREPDGASTSIY